MRITARLTHPHILPLHDSGEVDGFLYYTMPYVEGESLRDRLGREKQLPIADALKIASEVADALGFAHEHNVIHRDIKPENILLEAGHAVVADFGIARAITAAGETRLTETGIAIGTPAYLSPEQGAGDSELDGRSDLYSLGCVLYEMLAGEPPFTGPTAENIIRKHMSAEPTPVSVSRPTVPDEIALVVKRVLAKSPADRFKTAAEFVAELERAPTPASGEGARPRALPPAWRVAAIAFAVVAIGTGSWRAFKSFGRGTDRIEWLAVLPPDNLTGDSAQEPFVAGMHDELISKLSQIPGIDVISRTSAVQYENSDMSVPQIARELNVDAVIQSSVLRSGNNVRIQVQLIDAFPRERHVWNDTYDRAIEDVLALHSEVARDVAGQIQVTLTPQDEARLATAPAVNRQAYEAYLSGRFHFERRTPESLEWSLEDFLQATEIEQGYAAAYASASITYVMLAAYSIRHPRDAIPLAEAAARRAIELDGTLAEGYLALAWAMFSSHQWEASESAFRTAISLSPGMAEAHHWYGWLLAPLGRADEAAREFARALELDPLSLVISASAGWAMFVAGDHDAARHYLERTVELAPAFPRGRWWLGQVYLADGNLDGATVEFEAAVEASGGSAEYVASLGHAYAVGGQSAESERILADLEDLSSTQYVASYDLALIHTGLGNVDRALQLLEDAIEQGDMWLFALQVEPRFNAIRSDPRFEDLLLRMGFPE
jgi:serine/threonine-protein kinase